MRGGRLRKWLRTWRASLRDTRILFNEFRSAVIVFTIAVFGGGWLYHSIAARQGEADGGLASAVYTVLSATFLQASGDFPRSPFLQAFYFLMPLVGIGILAQGLTDFGSLLFNRRARSKEWEMAVASTLSKHNVLVGLGHLGYRVVQKLYDMGESVVVIELNPSADEFSAIQKLGIPVLEADATRALALEAANIREARTIILASQNDAMNLQIALKARGLNPEIGVVIRIFDQEFAHALRDQFGFTALSATEMAAPVFAAAATGADVTNPISVEGQQLSLARFKLKSTSRFANKSVGHVEDHYHLSVVLLNHAGKSEMHPTGSRALSPGDTLAVLGGPEELHRLMRDSE
jgi:Trk K+ transport system NAD-binding subunit